MSAISVRDEYPTTAMRASRLGRSHPVFAYVVLAFSLTWLLAVPILLSPRAFDVVPLPDAATLAFFFLATLGPFTASLAMTALMEGRTGVRRLLGRIVQWRVGLQWYLVIVLGYPIMFILGVMLFYGASLPASLGHMWPAFGSVYLVSIPLGLLLPSVGEETGWRGFALPRMQARHGPLVATLLLGSIHALWHLPIYFVHGAITDTFSMQVFIINSFAIVLSSILWTWVSNNARNSILIAMLAHASSNALSAFAPTVYETSDPWEIVKIVGVAALLVILLTKGRLGYRPPAFTLHKDVAGDPACAEHPSLDAAGELSPTGPAHAHRAMPRASLIPRSTHAVTPATPRRDVPAATTTP